MVCGAVPIPAQKKCEILTRKKTDLHLAEIIPREVWLLVGWSEGLLHFLI